MRGCAGEHLPNNSHILDGASTKKHPQQPLKRQTLTPCGYINTIPFQTAVQCSSFLANTYGSDTTKKRLNHLIRPLQPATTLAHLVELPGNVPVLFVHEGQGVTHVTHTPGPPDAVHVVIDVGGHIVVDDLQSNHSKRPEA